MRKIIYEPNTQIGNFTFLYETEMGSGNNRRAMFRCICGREYEAGISKIKHTITSCGCLLTTEVRKQNSTTHGKRKSPEYVAWAGMKARCTNINTPCYKTYGGRGVAVCERWLKSFANFYEDMGDKPTPKHSIDRIDVNGNYEPSNCRWATPTQQANNTTTNRVVAIGRVRLTMAEWGRKMNTSGDLIHYRLKQGWSVDAAIYKPRPSIKKRICKFKSFA